MAIRYIQTGDELPLHSATSFDDDSAEGWWGGVFRAAATVALAATMAITSLQTAVAGTQWTYEQNEPGALHGQFDEDFWPAAQLPAPVPATLGPLYLPDPEEIPAAQLHGQPDEDFWLAALLPAPVPAILGSLYLPDPEEIPAAQLHGQPDEDFWANPAAPVPGTLLYPQQWTFEQNEPGALFGQFDEDFWLNPVPPVQASFYQPLPLGIDPEVCQQPAIPGQPDEDFWQNPVFPVPASLTYVQQFSFDVQEPAGSLFIPPPPPPPPVVPCQLVYDVSERDIILVVTGSCGIIQPNFTLGTGTYYLLLGVQPPVTTWQYAREYCAVLAVNGNQITVERGALSSIAVKHFAGEPIIAAAPGDPICQRVTI